MISRKSTSPRARKSLGQHFLRSQKALDAIVASAHLTPNENIVEIGPGTGILTDILLKKGAYVTAIEKDPRMVTLLQETYRSAISDGKLTLIEGDVLEIETYMDDLPRNYKLIANIPYYITGQILRLFLGATHQPTTAVLLVQKEVAERIVARNGKESLLSLSVKVYGNPRYIQTVKAGSFSPPPKVDSAIIAIENISRDFFTTQTIDEHQFFDLIRSGFGHKRKQLKTNLNISEKILENIDLSPTIRAEDLTLDHWHMLYTHIHAHSA